MADIAPLRSASQIEAAESMADLSGIKEDPTELTPQEKIEIITAAYALLDLKKIDTSSLKTQVATIDPATINANVDFLVKEGVLPPVDVPSGGVKRSRDTEDTGIELPPRSRKPSAIIKEIRKQEEEEQELEKERLENLAKLQQSRLEELPDKWDEFPEILKNVNPCDHNSASIVMDTLFPKDVTDIWRSQKKTCRNIYEHSDIEAQCKNVVKEKEPADDVCYICGFAFDKTIEGLGRTCEHILPIIQAVFFLELYTTGKPPSTAQELEYDWAHSCCNYVKNDYSFLKTQMKNNYPTYVTNNNQISVTLSLIQNVKENPKTGKQKFIGLEHIQPQIEKNPKWKEERIAYIRDNKMKPIVDYIAAKGDNGVALMIGYRNCLSNENIHRSFLQLLMESKRKQLEPEKGGKTLRLKDRKRTKLPKQTRRHTKL
jgi:hypothetical protein